MSQEGGGSSPDFRSSDRGMSDTINDFSDSIVRWGDEAFNSFNRERQQLNTLLKNRANKLTNWIQRHRNSFDDFRSYDPSPAAEFSAPKGYVCSPLPPNAGKKAWAAVSVMRPKKGRRNMQSDRRKYQNYPGGNSSPFEQSIDVPEDTDFLMEQSMGDPWESAKEMSGWLRKQKNPWGDYYSWSKIGRRDSYLDQGPYRGAPSLEPDELNT